MRNALADGVERVRNFAVAVKLVAENVVDDQTFDRQVFTRFAEGRLVALDERVGVRAFAGQGGVLREYRDDAGQQVRARLVGEIFESRIGKRLLDHAGGGGLAVRAVTTVTFTPRDSSPRIFLSIFSASLPGRLCRRGPVCAGQRPMPCTPAPPVWFGVSLL